MVTSHELSLIAGLVITALFYWKYRQYQAALEKEERLDSFLRQEFPAFTEG